MHLQENLTNFIVSQYNQEVQSSHILLVQLHIHALSIYELYIYFLFKKKEKRMMKHPKVEFVN